MRLSQMWVVTRHELTQIRQRRSILFGLVAFPLAVSVGFPLLAQFISSPDRLAPPLIPAFYNF